MLRADIIARALRLIPGPKVTHGPFPLSQEMKANILLNRDAWPRQTPCIHPEDHAWLVGTWLEPGRLLMPLRALSGGQDYYIRFDNVIFGEALKCVTAKSATTWGDVQAEISKAPPPDMLPVPYVLVVRSTVLGASVVPGAYGRHNSAPPPARRFLRT